MIKTPLDNGQTSLVNMMTMDIDKDSQKRLDEILSKEPAALSPANREFLKARRSYLNKEQTETYSEVLNETVEKDPSEKTADDWTKKQLEAMAKQMNIEVPKGANKDVIFDLIQKKPADNPTGDKAENENQDKSPEDTNDNNDEQV